MGASDDKAEDDRITAFGDKVAAQTLRIRTAYGSAIQKAQDRRLLDAMRQSEAHAILNRSLTRNFNDQLDIDGANAAE